MAFVDKTKPSADWTPDQLYVYHERLGIIGDSLPVSLSTGQPLFTGQHYRIAWDEAEKWGL